MKTITDTAAAAVPRVHALRAETEPEARAARPAPLQIQYTATRVVPQALARAQRTRGVIGSEGAAGGAGAELAEAFKMLRTQVLLRLRAEGHRLLAVTSPRAMEGKSVTALNLALSLAADLDTAVLLVDADLRARRVQHLFGLDGEAGLVEHLTQGTPLPELLVNPGVERLVLLPAGHLQVQHTAELLAARTLQHLVQELKTRYADRVVVVDLPPLLDTADTLAFLPQVDSTLLVTEASRTTLADVERCTELLAPFPLMGTVLAPTGEAPRRGRRWWRR